MNFFQADIPKGSTCTFGHFILIALFIGAFLFGMPTQGQAGPDVVRVDDFTQTYAPGTTYGFWSTQKFAPLFGSGDNMFFQFVHKGEDHHIHIKSGTTNSFTLGIKVPYSLEEYPILEWEWKVTKLPHQGDVRIKERDDQAGSVCVVINPSLVSFDASLCYLWENDGPKDQPITSTKKQQARYLILRTGAEDGTGKWFSERRNVLEDYIRVFGGKPEKPAAFGFQIDSDSTASEAEVFYRNVYAKKK